MLKKDVQTANGALSYSSPNSNIYDGRISLFFKCVRGIQTNDLINYLYRSSNENIIDTFILSFYTRNCRGGKGERKIGRQMFTWLFQNFPNEFEKIYHLIPYYGRWDDMFCFFPNVLTTNHIVLQNKIVQFVCNQLKKDYRDMLNGNPISLCGKWCVSEKSSKDKLYNIFKLLCTTMNMSQKQLRQTISQLRNYLKIVETYMCKKQWNSIDFNEVPSCAMNKLKKAFEKHTPIEFKNWKDHLYSGKTKINACQLFPHEIIRSIRRNSYADEVSIAQWKCMESLIAQNKKLKKTLTIVDTSTSMMKPNFLPLDMACSLGILISNNVEGVFHNNVITFNENPEFIILHNDTIQNRYNQIKNIPWGQSTNLEKTFELILTKATNANVKQEDMPEQLLIISDMQFNKCSKNETNFEMIEQKYQDRGYKRPNLIFWNVNGNSTDFPVSVSDKNTCILSGSTPSVINLLINAETIETVYLLNEVLKDNNYESIRNLLT